MKKRILPFILAGALSAAFAMPVAAQTADCPEMIDQTNVAGIPGLAALILANVQANVGVGVCQVNIDVDALNNSLNNLLQNANINVLNDSLNNLLRDANIEVEIIDDSPITISVLGGGPILVFN